MTKISRVKKQKRLSAYRKTQSYIKSVASCLNCGGMGPHFVPPSFGDPGFYTCKKKEI